MKKTIIRMMLFLLGGIVVTIAIGIGIFLVENKTNGVIETSGIKRRYLLYVPPTYDPKVPSPLVISIHGYAEWPAHQMQISRWNQFADTYGFLVVYPSGTKLPKRWSAFGADVKMDSMMDVIFINDLINKLEQDYNIDPARIYANGLSNGGGMSFVLSCKLADRIAAIGSVSGAYLLSWDKCDPVRPVPMIAFHGTADEVVPYEGGPSDAFDIPFPNVPEWMEIKADRNGCSQYLVEVPTNPEVQGVKYTDCEGNADVQFYTILDGGHTWPGGEPLPEWITGRTSQAVNATAMMWNFFMEHPMPQE